MEKKHGPTKGHHNTLILITNVQDVVDPRHVPAWRLNVAQQQLGPPATTVREETLEVSECRSNSQIAL